MATTRLGGVEDLALISREHVLEALTDVPAIETGSTGQSPDHLLLRGESGYPVEQVVDRAIELVGAPLPDDSPLTSRECALLLRGLGFEVNGAGLPPLRFTSAATVGAEHARATWALAARERLLEVAATYGDSIDYRDLAQFVQRRSLIRSGGSNTSGWIGDVLSRVAHDCHQRRQPLLTALVVDARGRVGASYATALVSLRGEEPDDVDEQAAAERLECHRHFGAQLPADGGVPVQLHRRPEPVARRAGRAATAGPSGSSSSTSSSGRPTPRQPRRPAPAPRVRSTTTGRRTAEESVAAASAARPAQTCPVHFTVIPPSGVCDFCE